MDTRNALSPIIVFRNEGDNVRKTLESIKETATGVLHTLLVDDASDDGYDYESLAKEYGVDYHRMSEPSGSVGTRNFGATHCKAEHFVMLDAHMKFFHKGWDEKLLSIMQDHPNSIICSRTVVMQPGEHGEWLVRDEQDPQHHGKHWGAYICWKSGWEFEPKWTEQQIPHEHDARVNKVSCVLGAVYASTKTWWQKIAGLHGLCKFGLDESFMSIKTWLMGGECLIVKDWGVGHLYRDEKTVPKGLLSNPINYDANRLFLASIFCPNLAYLYAKRLKQRIGDMTFAHCYEAFLQSLRQGHFDYVPLLKYDLDYFEKINSLVEPKLKIKGI